MRLTTKSLTPEQKNAIIMACEALAGFRISYEDRFFHVNRDNTFATENTLHALSVVIHAFDAQKLQQIKDNPELKEIFRQSFKTLVDMLSELEARNVRAKYSDIACAPHLSFNKNKSIPGYDSLHYQQQLHDLPLYLDN